LTKVSGITLIGLAIAILALALAYGIIRLSHQRER
jgi:uncharacterized membrane protein (DUF373 family)